MENVLFQLLQLTACPAGQQVAKDLLLLIAVETPVSRPPSQIRTCALAHTAAVESPVPQQVALWWLDSHVRDVQAIEKEVPA